MARRPAAEVAVAAGPGNPGVLPPLEYLMAGARRLLRNYGVAFRNRRFLIALLVMTALWLLLSLLPVLGFNPVPVRVLSFLTFARGGLSAGLLGAVGGIAGKVVYAYLVLPLFLGQRPLAGVGAGLRRIPAALAGGGGKVAIPLLAGGGVGLMLHNFFSGTVSLHDSMAGVAALILTVRALGRPAGFLRGLIVSALYTYGTARATDPLTPDRILSGLAAGFVLALLLAATQVGVIGYLVGLLCMVAALVLGIAANGRKGMPL